MAAVRTALAGFAVAAAALALAAPASAAPELRVGVGRADITPPTGYYMMGWVRSDAVAAGQHTRLWARVIVLERGGQKMALVAEDLGGIPGGMLAEAAERVSELGFSERNVLDSASHTHSGPTGFFNFSTFNTVFMTLNSPTDFQLTGGLDPQLYTFMVRRLALAIRRADANLGPGKLGWGKTQITDLTDNRSVEAHLRNHGIHEERGDGSAEQDPQGRLHTLDPEVNVLRVDKLIGGRQVPVGMWSTFANHGTVVRYQFTYYNRDHHGSATQLVEDAIRRAGRVPAGQEVVNAYGNTDEGDQTAGLHRAGPAAADYVGQVEASAFMRAWRDAGGQMTATPVLARRWTRMCWCGQQTAAGPVADQAQFGLPQFTGSEEGRGPLFDVTGVPFEGHSQPVGTGPHGVKIAAPLPVEVPDAVPLMALRIGSRMIVSIPGEMTAQMGRRVRQAVTDAARGSGVTSAVISGLANEYVDYFTTPQEYDAQHYEGGATIYGRASGVALQEVLVTLTRRLRQGLPPPQPYIYDPRNGVAANAAPFSTGAASATVVYQPRPPKPRRLWRPHFAWRGGVRGFDRPLDRAFVQIQRRAANGAWQTVDSDLGLAVLWTVDEDGLYRVWWEPSLDQPLGTYRFRITANRYTLASRPFELRPSAALTPRRVAAPPGKVAVVLDYPRAKVREEIGDPLPDVTASLTHRPRSASSGQVTFIVDGRRFTVQPGPGGRFEVSAKPSHAVRIPAGGGRDAFGNRTGPAFDVQP
jgi:neutral ceramidase